MAFTAHGTLSSNAAPVLRSKTITNSVVMTTLASVKLVSGLIALGTAGALVYGHTTGISTLKGVGVNTDGTAGAAMGSFVGTFTCASNNQTVAQVQAICDVSKFTLFSASLTAAAGSTTGSNLAGYTLDLSTSVTLDETSALTTTGQYMSEGLDPVDSTRVIVHIFESQVFGV